MSGLPARLPNAQSLDSRPNQRVRAGLVNGFCRKADDMSCNQQLHGAMDGVIGQFFALRPGFGRSHAIGDGDIAEMRTGSVV